MGVDPGSVDWSKKRFAALLEVRTHMGVIQWLGYCVVPCDYMVCMYLYYFPSHFSKTINPRSFMHPTHVQAGAVGVDEMASVLFMVKYVPPSKKSARDIWAGRQWVALDT